MFENFANFFAQKKNLHIFIAALLIVVGIFLLKRAGLYEGLENGPDVPVPKKSASSTKAIPMG